MTVCVGRGAAAGGPRTDAHTERVLCERSFHEELWTGLTLQTDREAPEDGRDTGETEVPLGLHQPLHQRVSTAEVCNKRKCHKALRQFFDKVPPKHSYGMLFCSCPVRDQTACSERRRQTIVPVCSYEEKQKPNCLELQSTCKNNYICRSRLADFFANCQPEPRSTTGCLKENYADCLLAYSGLIGTVMTPNYLRSPKISVSPYCNCSNSGQTPGRV
ncbi:hypothetical protein WMY93_018182 [Mugilogobius chulae]|uniref:GDNF/GAS1 domain-containing protein n=1 Tax=Mugilogobius chulae TaxID=88201 RepID=A0AAW0NJA0_9GOBI